MTEYLLADGMALVLSLGLIVGGLGLLVEAIHNWRERHQPTNRRYCNRRR